MLDLTGHWAGCLSLAVFVTAYVIVILEETAEMRKYKPVLMVTGLIWGMIGVAIRWPATRLIFIPKPPG